MAGFEQQPNIAEIPEAWEKKREVLSEILQKSIGDSRQAEQFGLYVDHFKKTLAEDYAPEKYYLWHLLEPENPSMESDYLAMDIPDASDLAGAGRIEKFIESLPQVLKIEEISEEEKLAA